MPFGTITAGTIAGSTTIVVPTTAAIIAAAAAGGTGTATTAAVGATASFTAFATTTGYTLGTAGTAGATVAATGVTVAAPVTTTAAFGGTGYALGGAGAAAATTTTASVPTSGYVVGGVVATPILTAAPFVAGGVLTAAPFAAAAALALAPAAAGATLAAAPVVAGGVLAAIPAVAVGAVVAAPIVGASAIGLGLAAVAGAGLIAAGFALGTLALPYAIIGGLVAAGIKIAERKDVRQERRQDRRQRRQDRRAERNRDQVLLSMDPTDPSGLRPGSNEFTLDYQDYSSNLYGGSGGPGYSPGSPLSSHGFFAPTPTDLSLSALPILGIPATDSTGEPTTAPTGGIKKQQTGVPPQQPGMSTECPPCPVTVIAPPSVTTVVQQSSSGTAERYGLLGGAQDPVSTLPNPFTPSESISAFELHDMLAKQPTEGGQMATVIQGIQNNAFGFDMLNTLPNPEVTKGVIEYFNKYPTSNPIIQNTMEMGNVQPSDGGIHGGSGGTSLAPQELENIIALEYTLRTNIPNAPEIQVNMEQLRIKETQVIFNQLNLDGGSEPVITILPKVPIRKTKAPTKISMSNEMVDKALSKSKKSVTKFTRKPRGQKAILEAEVIGRPTVTQTTTLFDGIIDSLDTLFSRGTAAPVQPTPPVQQSVPVPSTTGVLTMVPSAAAPSDISETTVIPPQFLTTSSTVQPERVWTTPVRPVPPAPVQPSTVPVAPSIIDFHLSENPEPIVLRPPPIDRFKAEDTLFETSAEELKAFHEKIDEYADAARRLRRNQPGFLIPFETSVAGRTFRAAESQQTINELLSKGGIPVGRADARRISHLAREVEYYQEQAAEEQAYIDQQKRLITQAQDLVDEVQGEYWQNQILKFRPRAFRHIADFPDVEELILSPTQPIVIAKPPTVTEEATFLHELAPGEAEILEERQSIPLWNKTARKFAKTVQQQETIQRKINLSKKPAEIAKLNTRLEEINIEQQKIKEEYIAENALLSTAPVVPPEISIAPTFQPSEITIQETLPAISMAPEGQPPPEFTTQEVRTLIPRLQVFDPDQLELESAIGIGQVERDIETFQPIAAGKQDISVPEEGIFDPSELQITQPAPEGEPPAPQALTVSGRASIQTTEPRPVEFKPIDIPKKPYYGPVEVIKEPPVPLEDRPINQFLKKILTGTPSRKPPRVIFRRQPTKPPRPTRTPPDIPEQAIQTQQAPEGQPPVVEQPSAEYLVRREAELTKTRERATFKEKIYSRTQKLTEQKAKQLEKQLKAKELEKQEIQEAFKPELTKKWALEDLKTAYEKRKAEIKRKVETYRQKVIKKIAEKDEPVPELPTITTSVTAITEAAKEAAAKGIEAGVERVIGEIPVKILKNIDKANKARKARKEARRKAKEVKAEAKAIEKEKNELNRKFGKVLRNQEIVLENITVTYESMKQALISGEWTLTAPPETITGPIDEDQMLKMRNTAIRESIRTRPPAAIEGATEPEFEKRFKKSYEELLEESELAPGLGTNVDQAYATYLESITGQQLTSPDLVKFRQAVNFQKVRNIYLQKSRDRELKLLRDPGTPQPEVPTMGKIARTYGYTYDDPTSVGLLSSFLSPQIDLEIAGSLAQIRAKEKEPEQTQRNVYFTTQTTIEPVTSSYQISNESIAAVLGGLSESNQGTSWSPRK